MQLPVGQHILREDIAEAVCRAAGRDLTGVELAAVIKCFLLDISGTIAWPEFEKSWRNLQQLCSAATASQASGSGKNYTSQLRQKAAAGSLQAAAVCSQVGVVLSSACQQHCTLTQCLRTGHTLTSPGLAACPLTVCPCFHAAANNTARDWLAVQPGATASEGAAGGCSVALHAAARL